MFVYLQKVNEWMCGLFLPATPLLLERHFRKAAQLAAVQLVGALCAQQLKRADANAQMLVDPLAVKVVGHAGSLISPCRGLSLTHKSVP